MQKEKPGKTGCVAKAAQAPGARQEQWKQNDYQGWEDQSPFW
ncbi:hypothetical protein Cenrod_0847 [Candidatus Symbiobacter mobilis CR]|uniref:Uncharacterized protein n=1 Tax=Candidatus Symbiobacter mobilis CR TaxID=946483 RepID=U5N628_9BURK|nr:hypothetical protein Cenrod_0847 [Candidatus Symbiobacter mobilis CR]